MNHRELSIPTPKAPGNSGFQDLLLRCGLLSSLLYVITDIIASWCYAGYSMLDQNYSELLATGAPTRSMMLLNSIAYNLLVALFGIGIWRWDDGRKLVHFTAVAVIIYSILSWVTPAFFQMDMRGTLMTARGRLHGPMTAVMSFFILSSMGLGAFLFGKRFRIYSFVTMCVLIVFGVLTGLQAPQLEAGNETPWMGLTERINIYATMFWFAVFSVALYRGNKIEWGKR